MSKEPLNNSARSAFQSEKPQIVGCDVSDSSRSYDRTAKRARCGFSGETLSGRAFAGHSARFGSLIWSDQTAFTEATTTDPAKTPSRPRRVIQRFPNPTHRSERKSKYARSGKRSDVVLSTARPPARSFQLAMAAAVLLFLSPAKADLLLAGGSLPICSSLNKNACEGHLQWSSRALHTKGYQISTDAIRRWSQAIGHELAPPLHSQLTGALLLMIDQYSEPMTRQQFSRALRDLDGQITPSDQPAMTINGESIYQRLDDHHWWALLDHFEQTTQLDQESHLEKQSQNRSRESSQAKPPERPENRLSERLKEQVQFEHSRSTDAMTIFRRFVAMAREHRLDRDPTFSQAERPIIAISAASSRDPYEALDFYRGVFEQAGAEVVWLPLDAAVRNAQANNDCEQLSDWQERILGSFDRARIYPALYAQQQFFCRNPQAGPELIDQVDGVFLNGGDQWLTFQAFQNENGEATSTLARLLTRLKQNEIVLGGTSAGTAVQSGGAMITNGSNVSALLNGGQNRPPPRAGCQPATLESQAGQGAYCDAGLEPGSLTWRAEGGLGSLPNITLDTHFSERLRQFRLIQLLAQSGGGTGLGVDETTAVEVQWPDADYEVGTRSTTDPQLLTLRVHGANGAWLFNVAETTVESIHPINVSGIQVVHLRQGEAFTLFGPETLNWPATDTKSPEAECMLANRFESFTQAFEQSKASESDSMCIALDLSNHQQAQLILQPVLNEHSNQHYLATISIVSPAQATPHLLYSENNRWDQ